MRARTDAGRTELHLALIGPHMGYEFLQVSCRQILACNQNSRRFSRQTDRRKIAHRVVERRLVERLVIGMRAAIADQHRVAVRLRLGDT